jgi:site-specific DNA-methyltransferase (adenine-specific)
MTFNIIYNEDCLAGMARLPDKCIDMILCDLPYGTTDCKWDTVIPYKELWDQYNRLIKDNGAIILTATQPFATDLINSNRKYFRYDIIWEKSLAVGFANAKRMPLRAHELILVFYKHLPTYHPQGLVKLDKPLKIKKKFNGNKENVYRMSTLQKEFTREYTNYPRSVIKFSNSNNKSLHPTQKPLSLFEWLILTYSNEGDLILDNCIGSGTTGVACINTGRRFIGFETNKIYFDIACKRIFGE